MNNDAIFLTCPMCHKTKAFSYYYEIAYVCDCGYSYEIGEILENNQAEEMEADNEYSEKAERE